MAAPLSETPDGYHDLPAAAGKPSGRTRVPAGLRVPDVDAQAPVWDRPLATTAPHPAFWLLGAHGGAGASTLARTWAPAADAAGGWPAHDRYPGVVVVARTDRLGLKAAHALLLQAAAGLHGGCELLGLVTVADHDGKLPATLRRQLDVVESAAPRTWRIPFLPLYRTLDYEQMPVWSPKDAPPVATSRWSRTDPAVYPDPALVSTGSEVFTAAHRAVSR